MLICGETICVPAINKPRRCFIYNIVSTRSVIYNMQVYIWHTLKNWRNYISISQSFATFFYLPVHLQQYIHIYSFNALLYWEHQAYTVRLILQFTAKISSGNHKHTTILCFIIFLGNCLLLFISIYNVLHNVVVLFCLGHSWLEEKGQMRNSFVYEKRVNIFTKHV